MRSSRGTSFGRCQMRLVAMCVSTVFGLAAAKTIPNMRRLMMRSSRGTFIVAKRVSGTQQHRCRDRKDKSCAFHGISHSFYVRSNVSYSSICYDVSQLFSTCGYACGRLEHDFQRQEIELLTGYAGYSFGHKILKIVLISHLFGGGGASPEGSKVARGIAAKRASSTPQFCFRQSPGQ